jgi:hypothetical protein
MYLLADGWTDSHWNDFYLRWEAGILIFLCTTVASFVIGRLWGYYRARSQWARKHFLGRIIVSVNSFVDGWLKIRTVMERSVEEVFLNPVAIDKVLKAAEKTTVENPLLPISKEDSWFLLNFVLNAVCEQFAEGVIRQDAGEPVKVLRYALFLTCEKVGEDRIRKIRAMMIRQDLLMNFPYRETMPRLENAWHDDRIVTLRRAADMYRTHPDYFMVLEVCL